MLKVREFETMKLYPKQTNLLDATNTSIVSLNSEKKTNETKTIELL
jgi:hypothetical protein